MRQLILKLGITLLTILLLGCGSDNTKGVAGKTYAVKPLPLHKTLYFTGTIQPLRESALSSPIDAVVEEMPLHFGQQVKQGEVLFILNSTALQKQYNEALTDYLKSKDNYNVAKAKFTGTENLWKAGLLAKNNYMSEKSSLSTTRIALMQASTKLANTLSPKGDGDLTALKSLRLQDFDKIKKLLTTNHHSLSITAPSDGVLLYPPKAFEDKLRRLSVGSSVKAGQVLGLVGYLKGIRVEIDIPEVDIDTIHVGMPATITGVALGTQALHGAVVAVNAQAMNTANNGLPSFSALVEVRNLTGKEQARVRVGMSATVAVSLDKEKQILIPIAAVQRQQGESIVNLQKTRGGIEQHPVITGAIQGDKVLIESGLAVGDVVLYD